MLTRLKHTIGRTPGLGTLLRRSRERLIYPWIPGRYLYSPFFRNWWDFLQKSQHWPFERHQEYQLERLQALLAHVETQVPYYRRLFAEHGLRAGDCHDLDYIEKIPTLSKQDVRNHFADLQAETLPFKSGVSELTSGGSTGEPLALLKEDRFWDIENAFGLRSWSWVGYKPGDRILQVRGNVVSDKRLDRGQTWEVDATGRVMLLSPYAIGKQEMTGALRAIRRFRPRFIHAYATSALLLAQVLNDHNLELPVRLSAILLGSEPVYPHQRTYLEETFHCRVFSHYGQAETVAYAPEGPHTHTYHIPPEYGLLERLDSDGQPVTREGAVAEIVGTSFHAYAFPLIRYRTDDFVHYTAARDDGFGFDFPVLGPVLGRGQDVLVKADGGYLPLTAFSFGRHMHAYARMQAMQFEQKRAGEIVFRVVKGPGYGDDDERELLDEFTRNARGQLRITVEYVEHIPKTQSGKMRHLIQHLPIRGPYEAAPKWTDRG